MENQQKETVRLRKVIENRDKKDERGNLLTSSNIDPLLSTSSVAPSVPTIEAEAWNYPEVQQTLSALKGIPLFNETVGQFTLIPDRWCSDHSSHWGIIRKGHGAFIWRRVDFNWKRFVGNKIRFADSYAHQLSGLLKRLDESESFRVTHFAIQDFQLGEQEENFEFGEYKSYVLMSMC